MNSQAHSPDDLIARLHERIDESEATHSDLREIESHLARFRTLFNLAHDYFCIAGFDEYFKYLNAAWQQLLGFSPDELKARPFIEFVHPDDRDATRAAEQKLFRGQKIVGFENRYYNKDGTYCWLHWTGVPDPDEGLIYAVVRDVTHEKQSANAIQSYAQELERSNENLEQFAYVASHDLQEPLRMVTSYLQLLQRRYQGQLDDDADEFIGYAVDGANRMKALIDELLRYSRVSRAKLDVESVNVEVVLQEVRTDL